jgi:TPR repeat protein
MGVFGMKTTLPIYLVLFALIFVLQGCKTKEESAAHKALLSAEQGAAIGQFKLGMMYATGSGVIEDKIYAYMWVNAADIQGLGASAAEYKAELVTQMDTAQIAAAEKLYTECKEKHYKSC